MGNKQNAPLGSLRSIPGVGVSIAQDLADLGFRVAEDLRGHDPEEMYRDLQTLRGVHIDRCMLYVFRCAIYFVENKRHEPALLQWWNWKDGDE